MIDRQTVPLAIPIQDLTCPITAEIVFDPVLAQPCGHLFEREAIQAWVEKNPHCPCCKTKITQFANLSPQWKSALYESIKVSPDLLKQQYLSQKLLKDLILNHKDDDYVFSLIVAKKLNVPAAIVYTYRGNQKRKAHPEKAIADFDKAIQLNPKLDLAYNYRGLTKTECGDLEGAKSDYKMATQTQRGATYPDYYFNLACVTMRIARQQQKINLQDMEDIISNCDKVIQFNPKSGRAYFLRGLAKEYKSEIDGVIHDYNQAASLLKKEECANLFFRRGVLLIGINKIREAIQDFDQFIKWNPNVARAYYLRGFAYFHGNVLDKMLSDLNKAIQLAPDTAEYYNYRGLGYMVMEDLAHALLDLNQAIQLKPDAAFYYEVRGRVKLHQGNLKEAYEDYNQAIQLDSTSADAYAYRGLVKLEMGELTEAHQDSDKAIQLNANSSVACLVSGMLKQSANQFNDALEQYSKAALFEKLDRADAFHKIAEVKYLQGDIEGAKENIEKAQSLKIYRAPKRLFSSMNGLFSHSPTKVALPVSMNEDDHVENQKNGRRKLG